MPLRRLALLRFARASLRALIVLVLAAWGVLLLGWLTLHWGILPHVNDWRPQIEARASQALGVPVRIGHLEVSSSSWVPAMRLTDVILSDGQGREALRLPRVDAAVSPRSLLAFELIFSQLHIEGAQMEVRRDTRGHLHVAGLDMDTSATLPEHTAGDWFFLQREFVIRHGTVRWVDEARSAPPLALSDVDLVVRNGLRTHEWRLDGTPPEGWGQRFSLRGRFSQPLWKPAGDWQFWSGTAYAELPHADVGRLRRYVTLPFDLKEGSGATRLWLDMNRGQWKKLTLDVALDEVEMRLAPSLAPLGLSQVEGRFVANRQPGGIDASAERLRFTTADGGHWPDGRIAVALVQDQVAGGDWLSDQAVTGGRFEADRLDIALLARLAARLPLPQDVRQALVETSPEGRIDDLRLNWQGPAEQPHHYRLQAKGAGLSIAAWPAPQADSVGRPGWRHADVSLDANETGGEARLHVKDGALVFPGVFDEPTVPLQSFEAQLVWQLKRQPAGPTAVELRVLDGHFANADAQGQVQARWQTGPGQGFGAGQRLPGRLELSGRIHRGQATRVARYLPRGLPASVRGYVEQSVKTGTVRDVDFSVKGDLWEFPFPRNGEGEFRIAGHVDNVDFAYVPPAPGQAEPLWPPFSQLSGELVFDRTAMSIRGAKGKLWGLNLRDVEGRIADLVHEPTLDIGGKVRGPLEDGLRFVRSSPVGGWLHQALNQATGTGEAELQLALRIPLQAVERTSVKGQLSLANSDVRLMPDLPLLSRAMARLDFSEHAVQVLSAQAQLVGGEATVTGGTVADGGLRFQVQGTATAEGLRQTPELAVPAHLAQVLTGQAPYALDLRLGAGATAFTVTSPLTGMAVALPAPLNKVAAESWPLRVSSQGAPGGRGEILQVELGAIFKAALQRELVGEVWRVRRAAYALGAPAVEAWTLPVDDQVVADIRLPEAHARSWELALAPLLAYPPGGGAAAGANEALPRRWQVQIGKLWAVQRAWTQVDAQLLRPNRDGEPWLATLHSDQAQGQLQWAVAPSGEVTRVQARLTRLAVPPVVPPPAQTPPEADAPLRVPALDIAVDQFEMRGKPLGRLEIEARERSDGKDWRLQRLTLTLPGATLRSSGVWAAAPSAHMALDIQAEVNDAGTLLEHLGLGKAVRGGQGQVQGHLQWPGSALEFPWAQLQGQLRLTLGKGQFLQAEPGAARLLGILSLQSLPRRFTLDFRDVFSQGFSFDTVSADLSVAKGMARTHNLRIQGVQAQVLLDGHSDLTRETLQARMLVVPDLNAGGASLAYATVNPVIGLGTFLAQYLFRKPLREAGTKEFAISGTWSEPSVDAVERAAGDTLPDWIDGPASAPVPEAAR